MVLVLAAALAPPTSSFAAVSVLSPAGYGVVRFGASLDKVELRLSNRAMPRQRQASCDYVTFRRLPGIRFMVEEGVVTRADAGPRIRNDAGIRVGMSLAHARARNPRMEIQPHKYEADAHYLVLKSPDGRSALVAEESKGRIVKIRAGLQPSVSYVEGCA